MELPSCRGECDGLPRPCPFFRCRYHLPPSSPESCALDVAEHGPVDDWGELAELMGWSSGRTAQNRCREALQRFRRLYAGEEESDEDRLERLQDLPLDGHL